MKTLRLLWLAVMMAMVGCSKDPTKVGPGLEYHDPEILFSLKEAYPDTAIMRWYREEGASDRLLAQVEITGSDSVCAFFLVTSGTPMYFDIGWKRHGVVSVFSTVGPFNPENPDDYDPYWEVIVSEDTLAGGMGVDTRSSRTTSLCPVGVRRDSIAAAP